MKARSSLMIAALAVLLAPAARAQDPGLEGKVSFAVQGGIVTEISGNVLVHTEGTLFNRSATVFSNSYRQIYESGFNDFYWATTVSFGVTPGSEIFVRGTYFKKTALAFLAGTVSYPEDGTVEVSDLAAIVDPYEEWGVEGGYRIFLAWRTRLKSFVAPVVGVRFTDRITIKRMSAAERGSYIENVPLYKASTVPAFGADIGFILDLGSHVFVGLEAELRYQTKLFSSDYSFPGLPGLNEGGNRWSAPVFLTAGVRF
ncbi:MAG: hypothetical protein PVJ73_09440 [Acidobacteriota bacterium]|jgi:hypothetical protein